MICILCVTIHVLEILYTDIADLDFYNWLYLKQNKKRKFIIKYITLVQYSTM